MDKFTVACVQMRLRLPTDLESWREELRRYLRAAETKRARIVLFPELAGLMGTTLLLRDGRTALLRSAAFGRRRGAGLWERTRGRAAGWAASLLKVDLQHAISGLLEVNPEAAWSLHAELFGGLAKAHGVTLVAPSGWLPSPDGGAIENRCAVFGPSGDLLGTQSKVLGFAEDQRLVQRGNLWLVIHTEVGAAGIVLGSDVLYPEVGRLLVNQGAEFLLVQGACPSVAYYNKVRAGTLARMQDNQMFAAMALTVGDSPIHPLSAGKAPAYVGRSAIFAPQELTPRSNGVLVEMGPGANEGVVSAEWDFAALRALWESSDTPLRRPLPPAEAAKLANALYAELRSLPPPAPALISEESGAIPSRPEPVAPLPASDAPAATEGVEQASSGIVVDVDLLPLLGSVTSRWPLRAQVEPELMGEELPEWPPVQPEVNPGGPVSLRREDETDEMDAVAGNRPPAGDAAAAAPE